jgi:putative intracellular protease/amidase
MSTALSLDFSGFEEIEVIRIIDAFRRHAIGIILAAWDGTKDITAAHHITCVADVIGIPTKEFDVSLIPGAAGVLRLCQNTEIKL